MQVLCLNAAARKRLRALDWRGWSGLPGLDLTRTTQLQDLQIVLAPYAFSMEPAGMDGCQLRWFSGRWSSDTMPVQRTASLGVLELDNVSFLATSWFVLVNICWQSASDAAWITCIYSVEGMLHCSTFDQRCLQADVDVHQDLTRNLRVLLQEVALAGLTRLSKLQHLCLRAGFKGVPPALCLRDLAALRYLHLNSSTQLTALLGLEALTALQFLKVSFCSQLTALPGLEALTALKDLQLSE